MQKRSTDTAEFLLARFGDFAASVWPCFLFNGHFTLQPNEARVLILFGAYKGTVRTSGFLWTNPLYTKRRISLRSRNLNGQKLKVNDKRGNPIEIAAVMVWRVEDTAQACFDVEKYEDYVTIQSESAVRHLARQLYLRSWRGKRNDSAQAAWMKICTALQKELQERVDKAGVLIEEARLAHLAYAPEIAASDAPPSTGRGHYRRPAKDRPRRREHGPDGTGQIWPRRESSNSTKNARPPWSATCWWSSAASPRPSRSSTREHCIRRD